MDENAKKNERELRKYRAKLRMDYYPLPLRWFKLFRYVSMILNIISCISGIISYILIAATINNPEAIEKIQVAFAEISGMNMELFTVIAVADFLVTVYLLVLCVLVFKRMGTLAVSGYNLIVTFLISVPVINGVRQLMSGCLNVMVYPEVYTFGDTVRNMIVMIAFSGVASLLNYIYFRKRKSLFTDNPEIDDIEIDNGSVQLQHYDECPFCHAKINGNSSFCEHCGRNFTEPADNGEDNSRKE